ncbi:DUF7504 family protein [Natrinema salaciae]|uniref:RecA-superfamily ATPase, KaiC/GvpD/RAD55 family n=1 Tax=Natrinema salaciae TaxID=1186196 RepID=A0A1H9FFD7_9EURY|nr:hypothetical protein [Natrinema salaciae]SEQ36018.1 hypothetical protein SAMN04489841_1552 [Natrinema salaciae]
MEDERGGAVPDSATFARTLGTLKREGSNVLLVGSEATGTHETACQRLAGATKRDSRYRLFVTDERGVSCGGDHETDCVHTIDYSSTVDDRTPLGALGIEVVETIDEFADDADGFEPSELRVCVDSLVPLLREHDPQAVFRLLHMITSRIDQARGMGHYHVPLPRDHDAVNLFEPMFDAIVTVRSRGGTEEQQWYLRETETTTDWLEL